jgi:eukaryotic-like serine/threonine-protein kinase
LHAPNRITNVRNSLSNYLEHLLGDRYRLERRLHGGPKSDVFVARDLRLDRLVVIKALRVDRAMPVDIDRFRRETRLAAALRHPRIVPLLSAGEVDGTLYYTMPFIEGESLRHRLRRSTTLPAEDAVRIVRHVAEALDHAHEHGVVHRDVKPENILLRADGAFVTDFGIAKALTPPLSERPLTLMGVALGTPGYMAPEQTAADPRLDHRADLYALGVVAYEMLIGSIPAPDRGGKNVVYSIAARRADVPVVLDVLVRQLLKHEPRHRPTLKEVLSLLSLLSPRLQAPRGRTLAPRRAAAG